MSNKHTHDTFLNIIASKEKKMNNYNSPAKITIDNKINYTNQLKEYFNKTFVPYDYTDKNWKILLKVFNEHLVLMENNPNLQDTIYNDAIRKLMNVESLKTKELYDSNQNRELMLSIDTIMNSIGNFLKISKSFFIIPLLTLASVAITYPLFLIIYFFLYPLLPPFISAELIQSFIGATVFIWLGIYSFKRTYLTDLACDYKIEIIKLLSTLPVWACLFTIFNFTKKIPILDLLMPLFQPHLWLSTITGEYVFSGMLGLLINFIIIILTCGIILKISTTDKPNKNHKFE